MVSDALHLHDDEVMRMRAAISRYASWWLLPDTLPYWSVHDAYFVQESDGVIKGNLYMRRINSLRNKMLHFEGPTLDSIKRQIEEHFATYIEDLETLYVEVSMRAALDERRSE